MSTGTGFDVLHGDHPYLITNRHVLSGREADNTHLGWAVDPDHVHIRHNRVGPHFSWVTVEEPLLDEEDAPLWLEHPLHGAEIDVVALPLTNLEDVQLYPYAMEVPEPTPEIRITQELSIIGFPFGRPSVGSMGIWARGTIASEPGFDYGNYPRFLIDSRTRPGQSGSPVIFHHISGTLWYEDGSGGIYRGPLTWLLGVYSGRIDDRSDIGIVWKASLIPEIIEGNTRGSLPGV